MSSNGWAESSAVGGAKPDADPGGSTTGRTTEDGVAAVGSADATEGVEEAIETDPSPDPRTIEDIDRDDVFDVLSNRRRRHLLHYLKAHADDGDVAELSDISSQLAAWEQGTEPEQISYADRKNVHTALYQFHLPKMEKLGFVDYDQRVGEVELTEAARDLNIYLETVSGRGVPWGVYFPALSAAMTALGVAAWFGLGPLSGVETGVPALFVAVVFLVSSAVFAYRTHFEMRVGAADLPADPE